jgi:hypothetical protein
MSRVLFDAQGEVTEYELRPLGRIPRRACADDEVELRALVGLAWEQQGTASFREAIAAIVNWHDRRQIRAWERRQRSGAAVLQVLRETNPNPPAGGGPLP